MKNHFIIPIFIPDLGCPNQCVFCSQKKITGQQQVPGIEEIRYKIQEYLQTLPDRVNRKVEIAFYGGSFTAIPFTAQEEFLSVAWEFVKLGQVQEIRISTRPDKIDEDVLTLLQSYSVKTIELGVQSLDEKVLERSRRGHTARDVVRAVNLIKARGFFLGIQLMIGLPGDNQEKALKTCETVIGLKPDFVRIYPVLVFKETELARMLLQGEYVPWSVDQVVETAKEMLIRFNQAHIEVIRIGLQNSEEVSPDGEILAGPYHPAMGELVFAAVAFEQMRTLLDRANVESNHHKEAVFRVSPRDVSKVRGQKSANIRRLLDEYGFREVIVVPDQGLEPGQVNLESVDGTEFNLSITSSELPISIK